MTLSLGSRSVACVTLVFAAVHASLSGNVQAQPPATPVPLEQLIAALEHTSVAFNNRARHGLVTDRARRQPARSAWACRTSQRDGQSMRKPFRIASMSKAFTALAILNLRDEESHSRPLPGVRAETRWRY